MRDAGFEPGSGVPSHRKCICKLYENIVLLLYDTCSRVDRYLLFANIEKPPVTLESVRSLGCALLQKGYFLKKHFLGFISFYLIFSYFLDI